LSKRDNRFAPAYPTDCVPDALRVPRQLLEELAKDWEETPELSPGTSDLNTAATWFEELPDTGIEGLVIKGDRPYVGGQRQWLVNCTFRPRAAALSSAASTLVEWMTSNSPSTMSFFV
jgi:hypothetical protein